MFASVRITRQSSNAIPGPVETRKLSFRLYGSCLPWQKLTQKTAKLTRTCRQTVAGLLFVFVDHGAGIRRATYLYLDCAKNMDKN